MQKLPQHIYQDIKDTAARMYGYSPCAMGLVETPTFKDGSSTFYEVAEGQTLRFYTEAQLEHMTSRETTPKIAGAGSVVEVVDMGGGMWRFYSVVAGTRARRTAYKLSST